MKKNLLILAMILVAMAGCKESQKTEEPTQEETKKPNMTYLMGQSVGKVSEEANAPEYLQFQFSDGNVTMDDKGYFNGTGEVYLVTVFAASIDADHFPKAGKYTGNDTFQANTFYCTSKADANGFSAIYNIQNGKINSNVRFLEGTLDIAGTSASSKFTLSVKDENGTSHDYYYEGAAPVSTVD